jgi:hypothetical protein
VTAKVNEWLQQNGYKLAVSREAIRRVVRDHESQIAETRKAIDTAKAMAEVLKDYPATEASEAVLMQISNLVAKDISSIDALQFDDPSDLVFAYAKIADTQLKLSNYRTKAVNALEKAKKKIKDELKKAIQSDAELLERLYKIVDEVKVV